MKLGYIVNYGLKNALQLYLSCFVASEKYQTITSLRCKIFYLFMCNRYYPKKNKMLYFVKQCEGNIKIIEWYQFFSKKKSALLFLYIGTYYLYSLYNQTQTVTDILI